MADMLTLIETLTRWYDDVKRMDDKRLIKLLSLGAKVQRVLEFKDKITGRTKTVADPAARAANEG